MVLRLGQYLEILAPGLNWNPAGIDQVTVVNVTGERQYASRGMMLTEDENIVELPSVFVNKVVASIDYAALRFLPLAA